MQSLSREVATVHSTKVESVVIPAQWTTLPATLTLPEEARQIVLFPSATDELNVRLARMIEKLGIGTLLVNLLSGEELAVWRVALDLHFMARRLSDVARWLRERPETRNHAVGLFAAGTVAATALIAAANDPRLICAIASLNGRPDLALYSLARVETPALLMVDSREKALAHLNHQAYTRLAGDKRLLMISNAADMEDACVMKNVAAPAAEWFQRHRSAWRKQHGIFRAFPASPAGETDSVGRKSTTYWP